MKVHSKTFCHSELVEETGIFNEAELAKVMVQHMDCPFEPKDLRYILKDDNLQIIVYSETRPPRTS